MVMVMVMVMVIVTRKVLGRDGMGRRGGRRGDEDRIG
jgi:hypothetical protein